MNNPETLELGDILRTKSQYGITFWVVIQKLADRVVCAIVDADKEDFHKSTSFYVVNGHDTTFMTNSDKPTAYYTWKDNVSRIGKLPSLVGKRGRVKIA